MIGILICLIILAVVGLPWWYRFCESKENMMQMHLEHERYIAELEMCYGSEQSFLEIEDDEEHLASISPPTIGLPSLTDEEKVEAERVVAEDVDYARHGRGE